MSHKKAYPWVLSSRELEDIQLLLQNKKQVSFFGKDENFPLLTIKESYILRFSESLQVESDCIIAPNILNTFDKNISKAFFEVAAKNAHQGTILWIKCILLEEGDYDIAYFISNLSMDFFDTHVTALLACVALEKRKHAKGFVYVKHNEVSEMLATYIATNDKARLCDALYFRNRGEYMSFPCEDDIFSYAKEYHFELVSKTRSLEKFFPFSVATFVFRLTK